MKLTDYCDEIDRCIVRLRSCQVKLTDYCDEIDRLKARIAQLEADKKHLYEWGRKLETENVKVRGQLATELTYGTDKSAPETGVGLTLCRVP